MIPQRFRHQLLLLTGLWAAIRAWPLVKCVPWTFWEVWEAGKLLDYGFWARKGAMIECQFGGGRLPRPEMFNYTHHPYPPLWIDTALYALFGPWGIVAANAALGLGIALLTLAVLRRFFDGPSAFFGTVLCAMAPSSIFFDVNPNLVALGACFWPLGAYLLQRAAEEPSRRGWGWALAATVFCAGQANWFALTLVPAFAAVAWFGPGETFHRRRLVAEILAGAFLAATVFALQVLAYTPDFGQLRSYAMGQAGAEAGGLSRGRLLVAIAVRSGVMVGPALVLGLLAGLWGARRGGGNVPAAWRGALLVYFVVWVLAALALPRFFQRERSMYEYLIFPCAVFAAVALQRFGSRPLRTTLLLLAALGALYPQLQASIVQISETSLRIGGMLREKTRPGEVVFTNMADKEFPFEKWDVGCWAFTTVIADRTLTLEVSTRKVFERSVAAYGEFRPDLVYVLDPAQAIEPSLRDALRRMAVRTETVRLDIPPQSPGAMADVRAFYWRWTGQAWGGGRVPSSGGKPRAVSLEILHIPAARIESASAP